MPEQILGWARVAAALVLMLAPATAPAQKFVVLVRHAEKVVLKESDPKAKDPPLTASGKARAERLAATLAGAGIRAIHTTEFQRTVQTAAPLAQRIGIRPVVTPGRDLSLLSGKLLLNGPDVGVLVVGHGDTIPELIKWLGVDEPVSIDEATHDDLFIVVPGKGTGPSLIRLKY